MNNLFDQIEMMGKRFSADLHLKSPFDAKNARVMVTKFHKKTSQELKLHLHSPFTDAFSALHCTAMWKTYA